MDTLMSSDNPEQAIAALSGDEMYSILRENDFHEAAELLQWATVEQVQVVADFSLWSADHPVPARMSEWVKMMAELPYETVGQWIRGLDIELVALLIRKGARIYDLSMEEPPDESDGLFFPTPDRLFVLDVLGYPSASADPAEAEPSVDEAGSTASDEELASAQALIIVLENLYRDDITLARRILVGAKAELDSELQETAFRWRQGRMADHGFVDSLEAQVVYRELDPASVHIGESAPGARAQPTALDGGPSFWLAPGPLVAEMNQGSSLFVRALRQITETAELDELHFALVALTNRVLSADRVDPADEKMAAGILERMRATLDLAVEFLARDPAGLVLEERAVEAVRSVPLTRLFRLGVSLIGKVRRLARTWLREGPFAALAHLSLIEEPEETVFAAVNRLRPVFPRILDAPPAEGERPFVSLVDVARASASIQKAAAAQAMLLGLGVRPEHLSAEALLDASPADLVELDAGLLARTALVLLLLHRHRAIGGADAPGFRPLTDDEVTEFSRLTLASHAGDGGATPISSIGRPTLTPLLAEALDILRRSIPAGPAGMITAAEEVATGWVASLSPLEPTLRSRKPAPPAKPARSRPARKTPI
jgi:hypothetical protein